MVSSGLSFVLNDGSGKWENAMGGGNYHISEAGTYALRHQRLTKVTMDGIRPVLVVSDLDGTMVGKDDATRLFADIWERELQIRGGQLVYNTGRGLDAFLALQQEKSLLTPRALITAVGTEIYWRDGIAKDAHLRLDEEWDRDLSDCKWNRDVVQQVRTTKTM